MDNNNIIEKYINNSFSSVCESLEHNIQLLEVYQERFRGLKERYKEKRVVIREQEATIEEQKELIEAQAQKIEEQQEGLIESRIHIKLLIDNLKRIEEENRELRALVEVLKDE